MIIDKLILVGDKYLISPHKSADKSSSGLSMENTSNVASAPVLGTILKAGTKGEFGEGDQILFRRYSIDELKFITPEGEQTVFIVEGSEIVAVIKKDEAAILNSEALEVSIVNEGEVVKLE